MPRLLILTISVCLLVACGLKGPLYLPAEEGPETPQEEREQAMPQQQRELIKGASDSLPPATD